MFGRRLRWIWPALLAAAPLVLGCSGGDPFRYVKVSGKVTYEDGSFIPAERITLTFVPQAQGIDAKTQPHTGTAEVNVADGSFDAVTSHRFGDGLVAGRHKVLVTALGEHEMPSNAVPADYGDLGRTPLEVDTSESPFALQVRKPN